MMESARFLLCLLLWFASIAGGNQRKQGKMPSFPQKRGNFGSTTASEYENWKFLADGNDGVDQVPFCELQMMTVEEKMMLKEHVKQLLMENHHRHYHKLIRLKRATVSFDKKIWNNLPTEYGPSLYYVVPYVKLSNYRDEDFRPVHEAMHTFQNNTCIIFDHVDSPYKKQKYNGEDYLAIVNEPGCHSVIGRSSQNEGKNILRLELSPKIVNPITKKWTRKTCMKKHIIMHELFHLLGLYHEHQRSDRDNYVEVILKNVKKDKQNNFHKQKKDQAWGFPYNFDSIMNYRQSAFAKPPPPKAKSPLLTIKVRNGTDRCQLGLGTHESASELDFLLVSLLYNCPGIEMRIDNFIERHYFTQPPEQFYAPNAPDMRMLQKQHEEWLRNERNWMMAVAMGARQQNAPMGGHPKHHPSNHHHHHHQHHQQHLYHQPKGKKGGGGGGGRKGGNGTSKKGKNGGRWRRRRRRR